MPAPPRPKRLTEDQPIPLAFWFLFPNEKAARSAGAKLQEEDYVLDAQEIDDFGDWRLGAFKRMPLVTANDLLNSMHVFARQHDGVYLGFEDCRGENPYPPENPRGRLQR